MRVTKAGSCFRVALNESDVRAFAERWPCYGERRPLVFEFSASNGDLIDMEGDDSDNDERGVVALANDCALLGAELLGLADVAELRRPFADAESVAILRVQAERPPLDSPDCESWAEAQGEDAPDLGDMPRNGVA